MAIAHEARAALRSLLRAPAFTLVAVLTLALGIGATTAIYTVIKRVVLDPLPYPESGRLVRLANQVPGAGDPGEEWDMSSAQYFFLREQASTIEEIGAFTAGEMNVMTAEGPQRVLAAMVSESSMRMVGAEPALGRSITASDDSPGAPLVAVISEGFWRRELGSSPDVLGSTVELVGLAFEVVGVLAPGAELPQGPGAPASTAPDIWIPVAAVDGRFNPAGPFRNEHGMPMFAMLSPGVSLETAQAELDQLSTQLPEVFPEVYPQDFIDRYGFRTVIYPLKDHLVGDLDEVLWVLFGAVGLVLLIACANVANLLLVRVERRRRELAVRTALGAARRVIARQLLTEGIVLATIAGALGVLLSIWGIEALIALAPADFPRLNEVRVDAGVLAFSAGVALLSALLIAALPIYRAGGERLASVLAAGGRGATTGRERHRARGALVVTQVALALILIVGAGLLLESFRRVRALDAGVDPAGVVTAELHLDGNRYQGSDAMWRFYDSVLERVRTLPGVTTAGLSRSIPLAGGFGCTVQGFEDERVYQRLAAAETTTCAGQEPTSPGYFETMGIPLLSGRTFLDSDNDQPSTGAVVVSQAFADRFWPGEDPIGKGVGPNGATNQQFYRVVGVVGDVYSDSPTGNPAVAIYYPIVRIPDTVGWFAADMTLAVKTELSDPLALLPQIREIVSSLDPALPVANPQLMQTVVNRSMSRVAFTTTLLAISAVIALLLAAVGLYGVISYLVACRTREIGVRMALGARAREVERLVLGGSIRLVALGLLVGAGGALFLTQVLRGLLYGVQPTHPAAYLMAAMLLLGVAAAASYLPARRAARVDPVVALKAE